MSLGHFGTSAEVSQHFMKVDTCALVSNCLRSEVSVHPLHEFFGVLLIIGIL